MFKSLSEITGSIARHRRALIYALLLACAPMATSCFGRFPLTRAVYKGNRNVYGSVEGDNTQRKLAQSAVLWVFVPIYAGAAVGDMVVFNLIEFWTGSQTEVANSPAENGPRATLAGSRGVVIQDLSPEELAGLGKT